MYASYIIIRLLVGLKDPMIDTMLDQPSVFSKNDQRLYWTKTSEDWYQNKFALIRKEPASPRSAREWAQSLQTFRLGDRFHVPNEAVVQTEGWLIS
jgi:hypothetical protein